MSRTRQTCRGYVFLMALGTMAVAFILVFAMSGSVSFTAHTGRETRGKILEARVVGSALDVALAGIVGVSDKGTSQSFRVEVDSLNQSWVNATALLQPLNADHEIYKSPALAHRPGDVLVQVDSDTLNKQYGMQTRFFLCNSTGARHRPIDVTGRVAPGN